MDEHGETVLTLEEMEMDFAHLFDPNVEWENMQTEGSGWPLVNVANDGGGGGEAASGAVQSDLNFKAA